MNHTTIPVTAQGEPIPLIKLGQGREEEPQTFSEKLRAAGYQEPVLPGANMNVPSCDFCGYPMGSAGCKSSHAEDPLPQGSGGVPEWTKSGCATPSVSDVPLVSQRGFKAGVFATCLGGAFLAALYLGAGALICGCVASGCVGFVAGMLMTEDWK